MSLNDALETAKEILEQATLDEAMKEKKKKAEGESGEEVAKAAGLEGGPKSADGNEPEVPEPTDADAKDKVKMKPSAATGDPDAEEEEYEYEMEDDMEEEEVEEDGDMRNVKPKKKVSMREHLGTLFSDEDLSEEFRNKAETVFEAAVDLRIDEIRSELNEEFEGKLEETKAEMADKLDQYLSYVVENWMKENEVAIEAGIKTDVTESFMVGLKDLFETHYVTMPDESYDLIEGLNNKIDSLETKLNESTEKNLQLSEGLVKAQCEALYEAAAKDLTQSDEAKFRGLVESLDFDNVEDFNDKLSTLKENFFDGEETVTSPLVEEIATSEEDALKEESNDMSPQMSAYSQALTRSAVIHKATSLKD